jgi:hypothetical protein
MAVHVQGHKLENGWHRARLDLTWTSALVPPSVSWRAALYSCRCAAICALSGRAQNTKNIACLSEECRLVLPALIRIEPYYKLYQQD